MFVQIHMLQSMPPGNLNRDDIGHPKMCVFGGVTRGRISSQCLKKNIRQSQQFKEAYGDALAVGTTFLPRMVADELKGTDEIQGLMPSIPDTELDKIKAALASKFKKAEKSRGGSEEEGEDAQDNEPEVSPTTDQTGQRVSFPPPFAKAIATRITDLMDGKPDVYKAWVSGAKKDKDTHKDAIKRFEVEIANASKSLTVDIGMFGRMTTSDLVVNVEAACQVAHAIGTHEAILEADYFTAMDDKKADYATTQTEKMGAAYVARGENETFFDSAVYYKYLNLDTDALKKHLSWTDDKVAQAAGILVEAAARSNPTGKMNAFANHGIPELVLVEISKAKCPISYANAFLKAVQGEDWMKESAAALGWYIDSVANAFCQKGMQRVLLALGSASIDIADSMRVGRLDDLVGAVEGILKEGAHEQR